MKNLYILGAGGFAAECYSILEMIDNKSIFFKGFIGHENKLNVYGLDRYFLTDDEKKINFTPEDYIVIAIGNINIRRKIYEYFTGLKINLYNLISPRSIINSIDLLGNGNIISHNVTIMPGSKIGNGNIININSSVCHDSIIGNFNNINPGSILTGNTKVGDGNSLGTNTVMLPSAEIKNNVKVFPGTYIYKCHGSNIILSGNPAKEYPAL